MSNWSRKHSTTTTDGLRAGRVPDCPHCRGPRRRQPLDSDLVVIVICDACRIHHMVPTGHQPDFNRGRV